MPTYYLAIIDDNPTDIQYLQTLLHQYATARTLSIKTDTFPSAEAFLFHYSVIKTTTSSFWTSR